jgi:hypothetical protein
MRILGQSAVTDFVEAELPLDHSKLMFLLGPHPRLVAIAATLVIPAATAKIALIAGVLDHRAGKQAG